MTVNHQRITSLSEVDFDYLFIESVDKIEGNFFWWRPSLTVAEKKDYYYKQLQDAVEGRSPLIQENETFFMFKTLLNGQDKELSAGFIGQDGVYRGQWNLSAPDSTGSRNWIYTQETRDSRKALFNENGITAYSIPTFVGSDLYKFVKYRENAGFFKILEEKPTVEGPNPRNLVTLVISI